MYAFGIMAETGADARAWLDAGLAEYGYRLGADRQLLGRDGTETGLEWDLLPPETYAGRPWHIDQHECPFVAPLRAYLRVTPVWADLGEHPELRLGIVRLGRGVAARLTDDRAYHAVVRRRFDVESAVSKFGFDDGDVMLSRDEGPYSEHVLSAVAAAGAAAGLEVLVSWMSTCHNPVRLCHFQPTGDQRLYPAVWRQGVLVPPEQALADLTVEIWAFDFAMFDDADMWCQLFAG